ncbi:MAG: hypothetical protein HYX34_10785 [Actinobacteria bacterium]|nr:hypothetical protein [Actinomycetota bacterium]
MSALHLLASAAGDRTGVALVFTTYGFGVRHGIDWDHIAALTDITSSQDSPRRSMFFATLYALGHGLVVFVLGVAAIVFAERLPRSIDGVMERLVGFTLLALGLYVFYALVRHGRDFRLRSRWMLAFSAAHRLAGRLRGMRRPAVVIEHDHEHGPDHGHGHGHGHGHDDGDGDGDGDGHSHDDDGDGDGEALRADRSAGTGARSVEPARSSVSQRQVHRHHHRHVAPMPDDPFLSYGKATSFGVGMIHGIGAETPTQVLLFLTAAGAGGRGTGVFLLVWFLAGLITSNTAIALASTFGFLRASDRFAIYAAVSVTIACFSVVLGTIFVLGRGGVLPSILGS